ncbi:hypothetical protein TeGR_g14327, partial [Tetraparma gracilis]
NWQEELALEAATGESRCAPPKTSAYYKNHERVLAHTDRVEASAYQSTAHAAMSQERAPPPTKVGVREQRKKSRQMGQAVREAAERKGAALRIKNRVNYESTTQASQREMPSDLARLSNPATSKLRGSAGGAQLFDGPETKGSLARSDVPNLPPGVYSDATAVTYWTSQLTNPDKRALAGSGVDKESVKYVNAHGTSTAYNDRFETMAIRSVFGEHADKGREGGLVVSSTKGVTGHTLGAAGGIEAVVAALSIHSGRVPPTINLDEASEDCDLDYVPNTPRDMPVHAAMSTNLGFGGHNAALLFAEYIEGS